VPKIHDFFTNF